MKKYHKNSIFTNAQKQEIAVQIKEQLEIHLNHVKKGNIFLKEISEALGQYKKYFMLQERFPDIVIPMKYNMTDEYLAQYVPVDSEKKLLFEKIINKKDIPAGSTTLYYLRTLDLEELYLKQRYGKNYNKNLNLDSTSDASYDNFSDTEVYNDMYNQLLASEKEAVEVKKKLIDMLKLVDELEEEHITNVKYLIFKKKTMNNASLNTFTI
jgi:hypothetical protein